MPTALVAVAGYVIACAPFPFIACLRCRGDGKRRSPSGRAWRRCRRCVGTGERVHTVRRRGAYLRRTHECGSR